MAAVIGALRAELSAQIAGFVADMGKAGGALDKFRARAANVGRSMQRVGAQMSAAVTAPLAALGTLSLTNFFKQEDAVAAIEAKLKSMGTAAGFTSGQLQEMAAGLQATSTFGDEDILTKVTQQMLTFGRVTGETFRRAQAISLDLSATLSQDLQQSAIMVGKALNDPVAGLTNLQRVGIQFSADQKAVIKALVETGDVAGAQGVILAELERQFSGTAAAQAATTKGQLAQLTNAWGDFLETVGAVIAEILPPLIEGLKAVLGWLQGLSPETKRWGVIVVGLAAVIGPLVVALGLFVAAVAAIGVPVAAAIAGITALTAAAAVFWSEIVGGYETVTTSLSAAVTRVRELLHQLFEATVSTFVAVRDQVNAAVDSIIASAQRLYEGVYQWIVDKLNAVWDLVGQGVERVKGFFSDLYTAVVGGSIIPDMVTGIEAWMQRLSASMQATTAEAAKGVSDAFKGMGQDIISPFKEMLLDGKVSAASFAEAMQGIFRSMADRIISQALKPLETAIDNVFSNLFSGLGSPGFAFAGVGAVGGGGGGSAFAGLFAEGGRLGAGEWGIAGENGPELIEGPARITPLDAAGGGVTVVSHNTIDARGSTMSEARFRAILDERDRRLRAEFKASIVPGVRHGISRGAL